MDADDVTGLMYTGLGLGALGLGMGAMMNMMGRSEEHTSELSHTVISYAVFCLKKKKNTEKKKQKIHS